MLVWTEGAQSNLTQSHDWGFPKMVVPAVIIHFSGIFHYKPTSYWGSPILGNLHIG